MAWAGFEHLHPPTRILFGPGVVQRLPEVLDELGVARVLVVCGRTVASGPQLEAVHQVLGSRLAAVFAGARPGGALASLEEGVEAARACRADGLVSVGGGSAIDTAKGIALLLAREGPLEEYRVVRGERGFSVRRRLPASTLPHVAVPTTAGSSSEVMPWAGIRDEIRKVKLTFCDPALVPRAALLDPEMVVPTGPQLTASSGVTAVARAVEALYSRDRQPFAEAYALQALRLMYRGLLRAVRNGQDREARSLTLVGSTLSGIAAQNAMVSLVHAVGHAVGGRYGLQHGIAHGILLPGAVRRCLPEAGESARLAAAALGLSADGQPPREAAEAVARALEEMLEALPLPRRLREVGLSRQELPELAEAALHEPMMAYCPRPLGRDEVLALLEEAW